MDPQANQAEQTPKKGFSLKTLGLIIVLAVIAASLTWLAISQKPSKEVSTSQAPSVTPDPVQTTLTVSSIPTPLATPSAYSSDIVINTGSNKVNSVQLELSFDPKVLTKVDIVPGGFFQDPVISVKTVDQINGHISFAVSASGPAGSDNGVLGQGTVAQIKFSIPKGLKSTQTTISLQPKTQVLGTGFNISLLKSTQDATFLIGATPTPTKVPIASSSGILQ